MSAMGSQITSLAIVCSTVYSGTDQREHQSFTSLALCEGNSPVIGEFPTQRTSNAENVFIWWRHHGLEQSRKDIAMSLFVQFTTLTMASLMGQGVDHIYKRKVANGDCDLILHVQFSWSASKKYCALCSVCNVTGEQWFYFNSSSGICKI